jgi:hypothetical protein
MSKAGIMLLSLIAGGCSTTARDMLMRDMATGAGLGAGAGLYVDSKNDKEGKSTAGTVAVSALTGAAIGAAISYIRGKDDQAAVVAERDRYKFENAQLQAALRQGNYDRNIPADIKAPPTVTIGEAVPDGFNFAGLREDGCQVREFSLGVGDEPFVAVSRSIIMPKLSYYVLFSKDRKNCVKEDPRHGYLDTQIPGLGKALLDRAEYQSRKLKGEKQ